MKKFSAMIIALSIIFLCACSDNNENESTTDSSVQNNSSVSQTQSELKYFTEWGTDLLPADFPAPPPNAHSLEIESGKAHTDEYDYYSDWVRLGFICPENEIFSFSNALINSGYKGGVKKITNGTYYSDGFVGAWQNGKNMVSIVISDESSLGDVIFILDVFECTDNFSKPLLEFFPKFNGYSRNGGIYCEHSGNIFSKKDDFSYSLNADHWHWDFRFNDAFIGVEESEFEAYYNKLGDEGFSGTIYTENTDGCNFIEANVEKEINGQMYYAYLLYNQTLKRLDIAYTNDSTIYTAYSPH